MDGRSVLFQVIQAVLLALIGLLLILVVIQNNDTQRKLEELRVELKARPAGPPVAVARSAAPAASGSPMPIATDAAEAPADFLPAGAKVLPGPDGVEEYRLSGLRVRRRPYRNPQAVAGDRLVRSYLSDPPGLNPYVFNEAMCGNLFGLCNDVLVTRDFDDPERWVPQLATGWSVTQTVRVYLQPGLKASALIARWKAEPEAAAGWWAADIVDLQADGEDTVVLTTDSVRGAYAGWLQARLTPEQTQPVHYLTVLMNAGFTAPEGQRAEGFAALEAKVAAAGGSWRVVARRDRLGDRHQFAVVGDATALQAAWEKAFQEASPAYDPAQPNTLRGKVEAPETQSYDIRPTVRFTLRRGVRWQTIADPREGRAGQSVSGPAVTAADWVFTWDKILQNDKVPCEFIRNYLKDLDQVSAPDGYTVQFDWFRPYFQLFSMSAGFSVLPKHIFGAEDLAHLELSKFNRVICGTGPWKLKRWTSDVSIELERNPDYWGPPPHLTALVYRVVKDPTVNLSQFREGKLDLVTVTPDQWRTFVGTAECERIAHTESGIANSYRYVGYNERDSLFKDKQVRQALTMLVNRTAIIEQIYHSLAVPLTGPFHPETPNSDPTVTPLPYDPAAAKALLAKAGWKDRDGDGVIDKDGVAFRYTLLYPGGRPEFDQLAAVIQQGNRQAGIETELAKLEWSAFIDRVANQQAFQACILGWQLGYEADPYQLWHSSQTHPKESNFCGFENARADAIIVQARYLLDPLARQQLYREFHRLIADEQPYTFLFVPKRENLYSKRYEDVKFTLLDTDLNRWYVAAENQR